MKTKAIVLSGGCIDRETAMRLMEEVKPDFVIAADRGLAVCDTCGICPDYIVGDFDSLDAEMLGGDMLGSVDAAMTGGSGQFTGSK